MTDSSKIFLNNPTDEQRNSLVKFFDDERVSLEWLGTSDGADVTVDWPDDKVVCERDSLHAGGRISCPNAFVIARRLKIERGLIGNLMNHLDIRIYGCQLGCFK